LLVERCASACLVLATVLIHAVGLGIIGKVLGKKIHQETPEHLPPLSFRAPLFTGLILLGWSTAFFVMVITRLGQRH
jgi:hypothetical protein